MTIDSEIIELMPLQKFEDSLCNGCGGKCCHNPYFQRISREDLDKLLAGNKLAEGIESTPEFMLSLLNVLGTKIIRMITVPGIYFGREIDEAGEEKYNAYISGPCGHLETDGSCGIWKDRPVTCMNFEQGSRECESAIRINSRKW